MWVCVCSLRYSACNAHAPLSPVVSPALQYSSTLPHKRRDFRKKLLLNIKCVFWFYLQLLSETFLILKKWKRYDQNVCWSSRKYPLFLPDFNETRIFFDRFSKNTYIQNSCKSVQWEPSWSTRTDRRIDMTKLMVAFSNFAKAPKN